MFSNVSRLRLVSAWCGLVLVIAAVSVVAGASLTVASASLWLVACVAPPVVMLLVWGGGPPPATVAELLHAVNRPSKDNRP
jgi:hypothetical protein